MEVSQKDADFKHDVIDKLDRIDSQLETEFRSMRREVIRSREVLTIEPPKLEVFVEIFTEDDSRIHLQVRSDQESAILGSLDGFGDIECIPLVGEQSTAGIQLNRLINIYRRISQRTAARRLFGILRSSHGHFAIMESLSSAVSLETALATGTFMNFPLTQRLRFLYEICEAVKYFHSIDILLKSLSTLVVFVKEASPGEGNIRPIITGLENARLVRSGYCHDLSHAGSMTNFLR
jgi:serine/threonine protein kinase